MLTSKGTYLSTAVAAILAAAVALPAMAQDTDMEEIVVTARKRDESLHDVPVAVNAFSAAEIEVRRHRAAAGLHRADTEHDDGADAEPGHLVHHRARHLPGAQQRALGRRA